MGVITLYYQGYSPVFLNVSHFNYTGKKVLK